MENKENKKIDRKNTIIKITALLGLFLLVFGISYALFSVVLEGTKKNRIETGKLELNLTDTNKNLETEGFAINLEEAVPISQEEGLETTPYKFVVSNTGTIPATYKLKLEDITDVTNTLQDQYIRYNLISKDYYDYATYEEGKFSQGVYNNVSKTRFKNGVDGVRVNESPLLSDLTDRVLDETTLLPGECIEYTLNLWVDYEATVDQAAGKTFEGKIKIDGTQAQVFAEGTAGENVKYTYYNDGTLIISGTGPIEGFEEDTNGNISVVNNGTPLTDIIYNYLIKKGMTPPKADVNGSVLGMLYYTDFIIDRYYGLSWNGADDFADDSWVDICTSDPNRGSSCDIVYSLADAFNNDAEQIKLALKNIKEIPRLTRVLVDDGITEIPMMSIVVDGMLSLPNTLETIASFGITANYINIPNSVTNVDSSAIVTYNNANAIITIDNSRNFVQQNWSTDWNDLGGNEDSVVKYLR